MADVICLVDFTEAILILIAFKLGIKDLFIQFTSDGSGFVFFHKFKSCFFENIRNIIIQYSFT